MRSREEGGVCALVLVLASLYREKERQSKEQTKNELNPNPFLLPSSSSPSPPPPSSYPSRNQPNRPSTNSRPRRFLPPLQPRPYPTPPSPLLNKLPRPIRVSSSDSFRRSHRYPLSRQLVEEDRVHPEGCGESYGWGGRVEGVSPKPGFILKEREGGEGERELTFASGLVSFVGSNDLYNWIDRWRDSTLLSRRRLRIWRRAI